MQVREALSYDDVLLEPQEGVLVKRKHANIASCVFDDQMVEVPIIGANMPAVSNPLMATELRRLGAMGTLHRFMSLEEQVQTFKLCHPDTMVSLGVNDWFAAFNAFYNAGARYFIFDVAHGHHQVVGKILRDQLCWGKKDWRIMAGNVATADGAKFLEDCGVDAIKVGIGPGAACVTRRVTGFGVPQLTAVWDCANAVDIPICADGGIKNSGDIVKAIAAGADTVMIGGLLAGCAEATNPGHYYGNASKQVNGHRAPEGVEGNVPLSGSVEDVIKELAWGLRSGVSYSGGRNLVELRANARWVRCSPLASLENAARI